MSGERITRVYGDGGVRERRPGRWQCYFSLNGKKVFRAAGRTEEQALKTLRRYQRQASVGEYQTPSQRRLTISKLLDAYLSHLQNKGAKSKSNASTIKRLKVIFGLDRALAPSTQEHIDRWVSEQQTLPEKKRVDRAMQQKLSKKRPRAKIRAAGMATRPSNATINRYLQTLRAAYRLALKKKLINEVPYFQLLKEDNVREGFFEPQEWNSVRAELPEPYADFCHFGYLTGWRRGSARDLAWSRIDREARELRIGTSKNGKPNILPLVGELWELVERRWATREYTDESGQTHLAPLVFHKGGRPIRDFRSAWTKACKKAGVTGKLPYHDFRRTAARDMIRSGTPQQVAKSITGHATDSMFSRYNITSTDDKREALARREEYLAEQANKRPKLVPLRRRAPSEGI